MNTIGRRVEWVALGVSLMALGAGCEGRALSIDSPGEAAIFALEQGGGPKSFLVQLRDGEDVDATLDDLSLTHGAGITQRYRHALSGGAILVPSDAIAARIASDPRVLRLEEDRPINAIGKPSKPGGGTTPPPAEAQPTGYQLIGSGLTSNLGAGASVAVIDSGVDLDHEDLQAAISPTLGVDCVNESGTPKDDLNGHGSHVAGTIAAVDNLVGSIGVARAAKIVPVKVLNRRGSGSWSSVVCGIDYVTANAASIKVANMSLGGSGSECQPAIDPECVKSAMQLAIEASVAAGVTYAVAAGNETDDAANHVPSAYDVVITVSAYGDLDGVLDTSPGETSTDLWPSFTNFGADVDIAAPGYKIFSTYKGNTYSTLSGTSMASPHVAAAAALYLSANPGSSPEEVKAGLIAAATDGYKLQNAQHPERLLNVSTGFLPAAP